MVDVKAMAEMLSMARSFALKCANYRDSQDFWDKAVSTANEMAATLEGRSQEFFVGIVADIMHQIGENIKELREAEARRNDGR